MTDILSTRNQVVLARFALSNLLVAFDYDGTLAPIVSVPDRAHMRASTRRLLHSVATRYPCIVISGRSRADVTRRLRDIPVVHVSGNHGLEPWAEEPRYAKKVRVWMGHLDRHLAGVDGVVIEDKIYSISIHYRAAQDKRMAHRAIEEAVSGLRDIRRIGGKQVVNLVPLRAPGKGDALERARRLLVCDTALYVGDDDTDEDAFASGTARRLLSVRVGTAEHSRARFRLKDQSHIDHLLRSLLELRPAVPEKGLEKQEAS
jgi:trehalose 6-phosphate phosphatase